MFRKSFLLGLICAVVTLHSGASAQETGSISGWITTTPGDFKEGSYDVNMLYISRRLSLETTADPGAIEYSARFDVNGDGWYDLTSADANGPYVRVWLGSSTGYSPTNMFLYHMTSGANCDVADLNLDGWSELIHSGWNMDSLYIYWGTPSVTDPENYTKLPNGGEAVYVADFDKDTYLDICTGRYIYWGSQRGWISGYSIF